MKKFDWGTGIFLAVTIFVVATLSVVSYIISLDFYLVSSDHYEQGVVYQETIDEMNRADQLEEKVVILFDEKTVSLKLIFPDSFSEDEVSGNIEFYRPNDTSQDQRTSLDLDANRMQLIPMENFEKGKWIMTLTWDADSLRYKEEKTIII